MAIFSGYINHFRTGKSQLLLYVRPLLFWHGGISVSMTNLAVTLITRRKKNVIYFNQWFVYIMQQKLFPYKYILYWRLIKNNSVWTMYTVVIIENGNNIGNNNIIIIIKVPRDSIMRIYGSYIIIYVHKMLLIIYSNKTMWTFTVFL